MSAVAFLIFHPRFVFPMRCVVSLLLRKGLVLQPSYDSPIVRLTSRASSRTLLSAKQLPAVALDERVCRHPRIDLTEFHSLSFIMPSSAFNNLQSSHPLSHKLGHDG